MSIWKRKEDKPIFAGFVRRSSKLDESLEDIFLANTII